MIFVLVKPTRIRRYRIPVQHRACTFYFDILLDVDFHGQTIEYNPPPSSSPISPKTVNLWKKTTLYLCPARI